MADLYAARPYLFTTPDDGKPHTPYRQLSKPLADAPRRDGSLPENFTAAFAPELLR